MTTVTLRLHDGPAAGVDEPMEMLAACHERVHRMLALLRRLVEHLDGVGADAAARQAAQDVMRYFDDAAPRHHEDEERHVLPALRRIGDTGLADRIASEHRQMSQAWAQLRALLAPLARAGELPPAGFSQQVDAFDALYRAHVDLEDHRAYPAALCGLDAAALRAMASDMATRRGLPPPA